MYLLPQTSLTLVEDMQRLKRVFSDPRASLRGHQPHIFRMMESARRMENIAPPHTFIVSGTSSGKTTLLYLVAAKERGMVTVVVAPTVALEQEIVSNGKRYAEGGVIVCDWKDELADDRDSWENVEGLVVVQVESALTERFQDFLTVLNAKKVLQRVVIDEAHLLLFWGSTFRSPLTRLFELTRQGTPFLCMTATLLPTHAAYLAKCLRLHFSLTFRSTATIKSMCYTHDHRGAQRIDDAHLLKLHVDHLYAKYLRLDADSGEVRAQGQQPLRGIIFCLTLNDAKKVRGYLQSNDNVRAYLYHSPQGEGKEEKAAERSRMDAELANFCDPDHGEPGTRDKTQWLVSTSAAEIGINLPRVQAVLIWGASHSLMALVQMSGRAGRDHRLLPAATSIVTNDYYVDMVRRDCEQLKTQIQFLSDTLEREGLELVRADKLVLADFLEQSQKACLREQLHNYLHPGGVAGVCAAEEQQLWCGACQDLSGQLGLDTVLTQEEEAAAMRARIAAAVPVACSHQIAVSSCSNTLPSSVVAAPLRSPACAPAAATSPSQHDDEEHDHDPGLDMDVDEEWLQSFPPTSALPLAGLDGGDGRAPALEGSGGGPVLQDGSARAEEPRAVVDHGGEGDGSRSLAPSCKGSSRLLDDDLDDAIRAMIFPPSSSPPSAPPTSASSSSGALAAPSSLYSSSSFPPSAPPSLSSSSGPRTASSSSSSSSSSFGARAAPFPSSSAGSRAASSSASLSGLRAAPSLSYSSGPHAAYASPSSSGAPLASSSSSPSRPDRQALKAAVGSAAKAFEREAKKGLLLASSSGKTTTACGFCLPATATLWGGKENHDGGTTLGASRVCPTILSVGQACYHCLDPHKAQNCDVQKFRSMGTDRFCTGCLTADRDGFFKGSLHASPYGFGHEKCMLGKGNLVYRLCMYLFKYKIRVVNKIMGRRLKYRQCFMKANGVLAISKGSLDSVKPNKEDYVKWLHGAWMKGGPLSNAAVLFVGYLHYFKGGEVLCEDKEVWETLLCVEE